MKLHRPDLTVDRAPAVLPRATGERPSIHASAVVGRSDQVLQLQRLVGNRATARQLQPEPRPRTSSLPTDLRAGLERMSGIAMDDVRVHHGSAEPDRLDALAFTRGADIHLAPGEEQHLPHEAWHVVQQKQGRVGETSRRGGVAVNDHRGLEREADAMGARAHAGGGPGNAGPLRRVAAPGAAAQCRGRKERWDQTLGTGDHRRTLYFTLTEKVEGMEWRLKIYGNPLRAEQSKLGQVEIKIAENDLKIDTMSITNAEQGAGLGSLLTENAIKAVAGPMISRAIGQHGGVNFINSGVVNPIMLNAALGNMVRQRTTSTALAADAREAATQLVDGFNPATRKTGKLKELAQEGRGNQGFELSRFPVLWERMVYLATKHGVVFRIGGTLMSSDPTNHADVMQKVFDGVTGRVFSVELWFRAPEQFRPQSAYDD